MKTVIANQKERVSQWVAERIGRRAPWGEYQAIGLEEDGELIAGIVGAAAHRPIPHRIIGKGLWIE